MQLKCQKEKKKKLSPLYLHQRGKETLNQGLLYKTAKYFRSLCYTAELSLDDTHNNTVTVASRVT